jgi:VanZ family protein
MVMNEKMQSLCRYGFWFSVLLFFYGTLFPFRFDLSLHSLADAWSNVGLIPFWDLKRDRIHSLTDIVANILLTIPIGFFGALSFGRPKKYRHLMSWLFWGLALGLIVEILQLGIPSRASAITDVLNNGFGVLLGAGFATLFGCQILDLLAGSLLESRQNNLLILCGIVTLIMLLPFDISLNVSHIKSGLKALWLNPWKSGHPIESEWVPMVLFAIIGATAGLTARYKLITVALFIPFALEAAQLLIESHAPSLLDLAMNLVGCMSGILSTYFAPFLVRRRTGFILLGLAIASQGLSPYHFSGRSQFEWIPFVEYYQKITGSALQDALAGLLIYGLLVALWPRRCAILLAIILAGGIETAQMFLPTRFAGMTDIVIAGLGAWIGYHLAKSDHRLCRFHQKSQTKHTIAS